MKNKKLLSVFSTIDQDTGEQLSRFEKSIKAPSIVDLSVHFIKFSIKALDGLSRTDLGKLAILSDYIEYETNRLTKSQAGGIPPIIIRQKEMAEILKVTQKTVSTFVIKMKNQRIIFKIDGSYFINPIFSMKSKGIFSEIFFKMIKLDPSLLKFVDDKQKNTIKALLRSK
jgi:hypothetical protein